MIELDLARTKELLAAAVAERGEDFVYITPDTDEESAPKCLYVHEATGGLECGCIVGWVLHRAGVPLELLRQYEGSHATDVLDRLWDINVLAASLEAASLLHAVQGSQDDGSPWGEAVREALEEVGE